MSGLRKGAEMLGGALLNGIEWGSQRLDSICWYIASSIKPDLDENKNEFKPKSTHQRLKEAAFKAEQGKSYSDFIQKEHASIQSDPYENEETDY